MSDCLPFPSKIFGPNDVRLASKSGKDVLVAYRHALLAKIVCMSHKLYPGGKDTEQYVVDRANDTVYAKAFATSRTSKRDYFVNGLKDWPGIGRLTREVACPIPEIVHFLGYAIAEDKETEWWATSEADYIHEFTTKIASAAVNAACEWNIYGNEMIDKSPAVDKPLKKKRLADVLRWLSKIAVDIWQ